MTTSRVRHVSAVALVWVAAAAACTGGGGGDDAAAPTTAVPPLPAPAVTRPRTSAGGGGGGGDVETFEVFSTKNPFTPLAPTGTGTGGGTAPGGSTTPPPSGGGSTVTTAPATAGGSGATTGGSGGTGTGTGTGASGASSGDGTSGGSSAQRTEPQVGQRVALLDVFAEGGRTVANVRVNSTVYKVGAGDEFAGRYKVVSLSDADDCGRFLFGDDPFRLCKGEETRK